MDVAGAIPSTLIVVCCHAIFIGSSTDGCVDGSDERTDWLIEPFQEGETPTFIEHARAGVVQLKKALDNKEDALLVFSGGATKASRGCSITEGQSYLNLCTARNFFDLDADSQPLRERTFAENYATDSYQNILLSLIQYSAFKHLTNRHHKPVGIDRDLLPQRLVIVSHGFKRPRFMDLHIPAINAPLLAVDYVGIDPPFNSDQLAQVIEGDRLRGYGAWKHDLRGTGALLHQKRLNRGWDEHVVISNCITNNDALSPEVKGLFQALIKGEPRAVWPLGCSAKCR